MSYPLTILTPEGPVFNGDVEALSLTAYEGSLGVLTGHAAMLSAVREGVCKLTISGQEKWFVLGEGTLEVRPPRAILLLDYAVTAKSEADAKAIGQTA
jgi:F-type H+-transporting ATPase subunit epsilon